MRRNEFIMESDLKEIEKVAKYATSQERLRSIIEGEYGNNSAIITRVVNNPKCGVELLEEMAYHHNSLVRYEVAKKSKKITNKKVLTHLAMDSCIEVRVALMSTTTNFEIKSLLYRHNKKNTTIAGLYLSVSKDLKEINKYINTVSKTILYEIASYLLSNENLTEEELINFIKASKSIMLGHKNTILKHPGCTKNVLEALINKMSVSSGFIK